MSAMRRVRGFTLIELIIVLVIAGILVAIGVPNLAEFLKNSSRTTRLNELVTAFNYARSEAIKRNTDVRVCASTNDSSCSGSNAFDTGWVVRQVNPGALLRVFDPDMGDATLLGTSSSGALSEFTYQGNGFPVAATPDDIAFTYCDDRGVRAARAVEMSTTGHPGISRDVDDDGVHEVHLTDLSCP